MQKYKNIEYYLETIFSVEFGFPEDMAIRFYKKCLLHSGHLNDIKQELEAAFMDDGVSWKHMLLNDDYEVVDLGSEREAKDFIKRILYQPVLELSDKGDQSRGQST